MGIKQNIIYIAVGLLFIFTGTTYGQCKIENSYFKSGETLNYDLYFKWGILSKKAGVATLKVKDTTYSGQDAYNISLSSNSRGAARDFFTMDDTISCVITKDMIPLAFYKDAHEGDDYTKESVSYTYNEDGSIAVRTIRHKNGTFRFDETFNRTNCIYDMLSVVFYARTLNYKSMEKGDKVSVEFISGKKRLNMVINHSGKEKLKVNDGQKYNCIKLSLKIADDAFQNEEDAMTVYITDDSNRMPIRIDSKLKIGNARVILNSFSGNRHPLSKAN